MSSKEKYIDESGLGRVVRPVAISALVGVAVYAAVLLLLSLVLSTRNIPQSMVGPMATFALCVGAFAAGFTCTKILREKGLLWGLACGVVLSFILLVLSIGLDESGLGIPTLFKVVFILLCSMLGGVTGVNTRSRRRSSRR